MRLGFDGHVLTGKFQGTRTTLGNLLRALAGHAAADEVVVFADDPDEARRNLGTGTPGIERFAFQPLATRSAMKRLLVEMPRRLRQEQIDYGVFNYIVPLRGRSIVFIHDILPMTHGHLFPARFRLRSKAMFLLSMWRADLVISVSHYTARTITATYGKWVSRKLCTIPNGPSFPAEAYFAPRTESRPRYILCVGRIEQRKNVHLLVEAFQKAGAPGVELVIVGSFDQGFAYRFPDDARVRNILGVDEQALIALYRGASLFVYPSVAEGFGLPLLDSVLFGLPTIASDRTAMPEVAGGLAELFDPTAPDASEWLAKRIAAHFSDRPVATPSPEARRAHAQLLSWDAAARLFLQAVRGLVRDQRADKGAAGPNAPLPWSHPPT